MANELQTELRDLHRQIEALRNADEDYLILSVGARGQNLDMPDGNAVATVRMGDDEATAEAKYLDDAISLARAKIIRERKAREEKRARDKGRPLPTGGDDGTV